MPVTFARTRKVRLYSRVKNSERDQVWWGQGDYRQFRAQCVATQRLKKSGLLTSSTCLTSHVLFDDSSCEIHCLRGLENWSLTSFTGRRKTIRDAAILVMSEQECLKHQGITDPFAIAAKYQESAAESRVKAHLRGVEDERALMWQNLEDGLPTTHAKRAQPSRSRTVFEKRRSM